ncbi:PIN domain-containing protein [Sphaerimonospora thailandensis]|uniref:Uncharacterized protein n=1 Tax=Sphaerimonospora thailandensis TaxID=795644 RepID=A0A8J3R6X9_9ACTN|nr:PIN domain-containing protein [Sphaerimonospora thailandensis]GIH69104.1 hypothetical protein Mth01_13570 [Sphaerimonospora thailandensis]
MSGPGRPSRATVYQRLDEAVRELRDRLGGLPSPAEAEDIWSDIWHQEAHNSTAIEGNTLVLQEVEKLLEEGRAVGAKPLKDYMEVRGYGDAARWGWHLSRLRVEPVTEEVSACAMDLLREGGLHGHKYAIDAVVAATALRSSRPVIVLTSDEDDMRKLCGKTVRLVRV